LRSPLNYGTPSSSLMFATPRSRPTVAGSVVGTPIHQRTDINADRVLRQINVTTAAAVRDSHLSSIRFYFASRLE